VSLRDSSDVLTHETARIEGIRKLAQLRSRHVARSKDRHTTLYMQFTASSKAQYGRSCTTGWISMQRSACNHPPGIHGGPVCWLPTQRLTIGVGQMQWCHNNLSLSLSQHPWSGWYQQRPLTSAILTTTWCSAREQQHHSHRSLASLHYN
jgi:hypothetical protein